MNESKTRIFIFKDNWIEVNESVDKVTKLIESSKDGDFIALTLSTTGESIYMLRDRITLSATGKPIYVLRDHVAYFSAN